MVGGVGGDFSQIRVVSGGNMV